MRITVLSKKHATDAFWNQWSDPSVQCFLPESLQPVGISASSWQVHCIVWLFLVRDGVLVLDTIKTGVSRGAKSAGTKVSKWSWKRTDRRSEKKSYRNAAWGRERLCRVSVTEACKLNQTLIDRVSVSSWR